jgi:isochorismate hydrolase
MYTNPKTKYKGNLSRDKQRWTKTLRRKWLLMKDYNMFLSKFKESNPSTMTMSSKRIMTSRSSIVNFK